MKTARVIITTECNFSCEYCCNRIPKVQKSFKMTTIDQFLEMAGKYDSISITGGEPLLVVEKLGYLLRNLPRKTKRFLYTNGTSQCPEYLARMLDGINIGLHICNSKPSLIRIMRDARELIHCVDSIRFHIQKGAPKDFEDLFYDLYKQHQFDPKTVKIIRWKMNQCDNTKEDRWII